MPRPYKIILFASICLALGLFVHDAVYDNPGGRYPLSAMLTDLLFAGTIYTGIFFALLIGVVHLRRWVFKKN
ncbi:MAG: hypothetical protein ACTHKV_00175 [Flavipsychrobacter sp.]